MSVRLGPSMPPPAAQPRAALLVTAGAAVVTAALIAVVPAVPPSRSLRGLHVEVLWTRRSCQEASGYAVVALGLVGLVLSLRKRWKRFAYGEVAGLRVLHGALGVAALVGVGCHTGLHVGERMNRLLTLDFLALSALGGLAAAAHGLANPLGAAHRRLLATRLHLLLLIPLPVLLALHVLGAYYF